MSVKLFWYHCKAYNCKIKKGCLQNNKLINNNPGKILQNKRPKTNSSLYKHAAMHFLNVIK